MSDEQPAKTVICKIFGCKERLVSWFDYKVDGFEYECVRCHRQFHTHRREI